MLSAQLSTGAPIILTPRPPTQPLTVAASQVTDGRCTILQPNQHTLVSPTDSSGIFYQYPFLQPTVIDYGAYDAGSGGKVPTDIFNRLWRGAIEMESSFWNNFFLQERSNCVDLWLLGSIPIRGVVSYKVCEFFLFAINCLLF